MLVLSQSFLSSQTDSELALVLGIMVLLLITAIVLFIAANGIGKIQRQNEAEKKCPYCAESIKKEATICRFCGRDLPIVESPQQPVVIEKIEFEPSHDQPVPVPEPVIQQPVITELVTQQPPVTIPEPKIQTQKQTVDQTKSVLAFIFLVLFVALVAGIMIQSNSESSIPSPTSQSPTLYPTSSSSSYSPPSSNSSSSSSYSSDEKTVSLYYGGVEILCGRSEQDFKDLIDTLVDKDDYGFQEMFLTDRAFMVDSGTNALVLDINFTNAKVRILEGDHENELGWVAIEAIGR